MRTQFAPRELFFYAFDQLSSTDPLVTLPYGLVFHEAMGADGEALVGAFLDDKPLIDSTEFDPSLDAVFIKDEHAVLLARRDLEEGFGGVGSCR